MKTPAAAALFLQRRLGRRAARQPLFAAGNAHPGPGRARRDLPRDDILDLARATPWERWFGAEQTLRVDTSAIKSPVQSLQYCNLRAKDGICDRLREREGERPDIDTVRPDARVHLFLTGHTATLYLDTSGESLFKRGWRLDKGEAPLRENLAAGMLALAGWDPAAPLLDPFCGSGTILIEAAWIALGVPPGISRPFGFERLRGHDPRRWRDLKEDARARILPQLDAPLVGYDLDPQAIEFARNNAERAWLTSDSIRFEVGDARQVQAPADHGWIVTNPPYGERMPTEQDAQLWSEWATCLKRNFAGWQLHIITSDLELPQRMRLKQAPRPAAQRRAGLPPVRLRAGGGGLPGRLTPDPRRPETGAPAPSGCLVVKAPQHGAAIFAYGAPPQRFGGIISYVLPIRTSLLHDQGKPYNSGYPSS